MSVARIPNTQDFVEDEDLSPILRDKNDLHISL